MCRKRPYDVNQMIALRRQKIVLCDICIRKLYELISSSDAPPPADLGNASVEK
jgi:hypothetical protein